MAFLGGLFGNANERYIKSLQPIIDRISSREPELQKLSNDELQGKTEEFKQRLAAGESLDDILPDAFAVVREVARRTLGQRHYDVQLIGGIVLHQGKIAQMRTGEGKTLVATLPVYLNALAGHGVHVVTVNDYLARRDATWMGQIYNALGLSVGCINHEASYCYDASHTTKAEDATRDTEGSFKVVHEFLRPVQRRQAYAADITYGTNNEYGFDYLRDNMAYAPEQIVQRKHHFAIVDEVDSILIDESRTPLIISAPDEDSGALYQTFAKVVPRLVDEEDYTVDLKEAHPSVVITEKGIEKVEKTLNLDNIYNEGGMKYVHHLEQALKAQVLFKRDKQYVVKDGEVIIVDEFTGRLMPGRRWSEGLHQAVEAKEGVKIQKESRTMATITFQNYFRLYHKLSGMTGTAQTSAEEFHKVYTLDVITVPTHKSLIRQDLPDRIYKNEIGKYRAIVAEVKARHEKGQPVLIGTVSIERNEYLSLLLDRDGVPHTMLNAKNHEREGEIIAQAGRYGGVTLATNIAGRGVDIILGGNPASAEDAARVREVGGLHVLGTERHEARRIDDQLRGRAGRQGDPGSSQFFVSTEDELVKRFGGDRLKGIMETLGVGEDDVIENRFVSSAIAQAQSRIEGNNFDIRKYTLEYDDVLNKQRETIYGLRRSILLDNKAVATVRQYIDEYVDRMTTAHLTGGSDDISQIMETLKAIIGKEPDHALLTAAASHDAETLRAAILEYFIARLGEREKEMGPDQMRMMQKFVLLRTIDDFWVDHLTAMDYLKSSVSLRSFGQRDPLAEYKVEGQKMFTDLLAVIKSSIVEGIFKVTIAPAPVQQVKLQESRPATGGESKNQSPSPQPIAGAHEPGRNDPCPCGSGKKYKKCGLLNTAEHQQLMARK